jgi:hypothetical protein
MFHSMYELENLSRQLPAERLQEAENDRLVMQIKRSQEKHENKARGISSRLFNRWILKTPPLETTKG